MTRPVPRDSEAGASSHAMTGACLTVSQVQSIPWSAAPSSRALLLVTSAFVTPIVTRGVAATPNAKRAAAVLEVPVSFQRKRRAQVGAIVDQANRFLQGSEIRCVWRTSAHDRYKHEAVVVQNHCEQPDLIPQPISKKKMG